MNVYKLLRNTVRILKTVNTVGNNSVTLYKVPGTASMKHSYAVESFDQKGRTIERRTFRHLKSIQDAEEIYHWIVTLSMNQAV